MADLFDRFEGSAGVLSGHTADSGDTWGPSGSTMAIDGSGSAYPGSAPNASEVTSSWTPPGTDYAASIVFGAGFRQTNIQGGIILRGTISAVGTMDYYCARIEAGSPDTLALFRVTYVSGTQTNFYFIGSEQNLGAQIQTGDTLTVSVAGTSPPVVTAFINGTQIYQASDTTGPPITSADSVGLFVASDTGDTNTDIIRTMWAGSIGGPSAGISPSSASVAYGDTQSFSATDLLPNETADWTATSGSVSPSSGSSTTYTAPGSGSSDTVTWTSEDLPTHTASASVSLSSSAWLVIENMAVGSPSPIVVVSSSASSGPRTVVVTGWPASWTSFPMILTATRSGALLGNLEATAYDSGTTTLTIFSVTGGYADFALDAGDVFQNRVCVEVIEQIQSAVDSVDASLSLLGTINAQTGTSYTLALTDAGQFVTMSNASAITLTVPPNSSVAFAVSTVINLAQTGAGQVTVAPGGGVTINSYDAHTNLAGQYASATLKKTATDTWLLVGNLA